MNKSASNPEIDTGLFLAMKYRKPVVLLKDIIPEYLPHLDERTAAKQAAACKLPFPAFRAHGAKSPWMVNVADIACWLDQAREAAANDWLASR